MKEEMIKKLNSIGIQDTSRYEGYADFEDAYKRGESHDITCTALAFLTENKNEQEKKNMIFLSKALIEKSDDSETKSVCVAIIDKMMNNDASWEADMADINENLASKSNPERFIMVNITTSLACSLKDWESYNIFGWVCFMVLFMINIGITHIDHGEADALDLSRQLREAHTR